MIRRIGLLLLTVAAVASAVLGLVSRNRRVGYRCEPIARPNFWKLYSATAEHGMLRVSFASLGKFEEIADRDIPDLGWPHDISLLSPAPPMTLWRRLELKGFYRHWSANWSFGGGFDLDGKYHHVRAMRRTIGFGGPAWFWTALFGFLPVLTMVRHPSRRRKQRRKLGLCVACGYDLRGLPTSRCPECGTQNAPASRVAVAPGTEETDERIVPTGPKRSQRASSPS